MEKSELAPDPWFSYLMPDVGVWYDSKELLLLFFVMVMVDPRAFCLYISIWHEFASFE